MAILSTVFLVLAIIVAIVFALLVLITGKGDAMSGGGSVRTTYKGKATFDDIMGRATLILGVSFMALVLLYNIVSVRARGEHPSSAPAVSSNLPAKTPDTNVSAPAGNTPATNSPAATNSAPAGNTPAATNTPAAGNAPAATNTPAAGNAPAAANN